MKKKTKYIIFPHFTVSFLIHWGLFIFIIVVWAIWSSDKNNNDYLLLSLKIVGMVLPIILLVSTIIFNVFYWNAPVVINAEGMSQRHGFHKIKMKWEEIDTVQCRTHRPKFFRNDCVGYAPKLVFISTEQGYKVSIVMEKYVRKVFFRICENSELKQKCQTLLDSCDFPFL